MAKERKHSGLPPAEDTRVGYSRPPKQHRFKPGGVGNPWGCKGKPKPEIDFLDETVVIPVGGKPRRMTRDETVDLALYKSVMAGNVSAARELDKRRKERRANRSEAVTAETLSGEDQAAFERLIVRQARGLRSTNSGMGLSAPADASPSESEESGGAA